MPMPVGLPSEPVKSVSETDFTGSLGKPTGIGIQSISGGRPTPKQEAQLPQRDSASATHVFLGQLTA